MKDNPNLRMTIIFSFIGVFLFVAFYIPDFLGGMFLRLCAVGGAVVSGSIALVTGINWLLFMASLRVRDFSYARGYVQLQMKQIEKDMIKEMKELGPDQTEALVSQRLIVGIIPGEPIGPLWQLELPGGKVAWTFVTQFIRVGLSLPPLRDYGDRTWGRKQAQLMTDYFIGQKWAVPAVGNESATFVSLNTKYIALVAIGYLDPKSSIRDMEVTVDETYQESKSKEQ